MLDITMGTLESKFADIIWENEPISSTELSKQSAELLGWKKSTSYTVLKRLCNKGIFQNYRGTVISLISRQQFYATQCEKFVEDFFSGSFTSFLESYTSRIELSQEELSCLQNFIDKQVN